MGEPRVRVFLSHKAETDADRSVTRFAEELEAVTNGALDVFVAGDDVGAGQEWRRVISDRLREANLLLLLFTEPHLDWGWCLYEVGLYTRLMDVDQHEPPIVCIFPPGSNVPTPIEHIQGIEATLEGVAGFLEDFYVTNKYFCSARGGGDVPEPLAGPIPRVALERLARMCVALYPPLSREKHHPCHRMVLTIPDDVELVDHTSLREATVGASDRTLEKLFGTTDRNKKWGELLDRLPPTGSNGRWQRELFESIMAAARRDEFEPITTTFLGRKDNIYCPEVYSVTVTEQKDRTRRPAKVTVIFDKVTAPSVVGDEVFNLIRANFRFREEVLDRFADIDGQIRADGADIVFARLHESIGVIEHEAEIHGFFEPATLREAYRDGYDAELKCLEATWHCVSGELKMAIEDHQASDAQRCLGRLAELNWRFAVRAAARHLELLRLHPAASAGELHPVDPRAGAEANGRARLTA